MRQGEQGRERVREGRERPAACSDRFSLTTQHRARGAHDSTLTAPPPPSITTPHPKTNQLTLSYFHHSLTIDRGSRPLCSERASQRRVVFFEPRSRFEHSAFMGFRIGRGVDVRLFLLILLLVL